MGDTQEFSQGLLDPKAPVPALVKGRIARRYAVYRNNVTVGLVSALEANFPAVRALLGLEYFQGFAREFAQQHPPTSPVMFHYGAAFPHVLENDNDLANYPYLGDVARLEILWRESYHAADAAPLAADALAAIDPEALFEARFIAHPAMRLLTSRFAVHTIFAINRLGHETTGYDPAEAQSVLVTRPHHEGAVHALSSAQHLFFHALKERANLAEALDRACETEPEFDLAGTLALLLQSGAFQSLQTENRPLP